MKNYKSLNEEIDNIKHLLSYKKGSVLIEQEEDSNLKLIQDACKHFNTLSDDDKNSFIVYTSGKTSTGMPLDPLMMCKEPIDASWVKDQDITLLNKLLSGNAEDGINEQSGISVDRDGNRINFNLKVELDKLRNGLLGMFVGLFGAGVLKERMSFKSFVDEVINAINTTFEDNPQKIKNLIPSFSTLKKEIKKVLRGNYSGPKFKVENTSKMEEDIKTALVDWIQSGHVARTKKSKDIYGVTDEEINTFRQKLEGIKLTNKKEIKETKMRIRKNGRVVNLTESDLRRIAKIYLNEQTGIPTKCLNCVKNALGEKYIKKATNIAEMLQEMETPELSDIVELLEGVDLMDVWTIGPELLKCITCMEGGNSGMY